MFAKLLKQEWRSTRGVLGLLCLICLTGAATAPIPIGTTTLRSTRRTGPKTGRGSKSLLTNRSALIQ